MISGFKRLYGSNPLHLLGHLAVFAVAGFSIDTIIGGGGWINYIVWFLAAAVLHDLVLLPLYSALDRAMHHTPAMRRSPTHPALVNHLRVPAIVAGVLLLVYLPLIIGKSSRNYRSDTGHDLAGYTRNWLLITAGVFLASALVYVARLARRRVLSSRPS